MSVVHNHPHPLAMTVVTPTNTVALKKYGKVRVEDWDDRVSGLTIWEKISRGTFKEAHAYSELFDSPEMAESRSMMLVTASHKFTDSVRCHTLDTGEVVLLHPDWLPDSS